MTPRSQAAPAGPSGGLNGYHVLAVLVAFFGVVFAVNGVFLASALSTHTGVVSVEPYVKGLKYNERIAAGERQARLGWQETVEVAMDGRVVVALSDADGRPIQALKLSGSIGRPTTSRLDRTLAFAEVAPGRYLAESTPMEKGTWVLAVEAVSRDHGAEPVYRLRRRAWLKP